MKRLFTCFLTLAMLLTAGILPAETVYHFQEGFATSSPDGWIRQCSATSSLNHAGLDFSGNYAAKFDAAGSGRYGKNLISPLVTGADTLSFYVSKNANATYMTLYVGMVTGSDTTIVRTLNAYEFPNKSATPGFEEIRIPLNTEESFQVIFYATVSEDPELTNVGWFVVDDISLSKYSGAVTDPDPVVAKISTDFSDGTWGTPATSAPASGSYPVSSVNGFNLVNAVLLTGSVTCETGEKHTNRILIDKSSQGGALEFPPLTTVGEIELHAATGSEGMSFRLEEWVDGAWNSLGTFITRKTPDSIYTIPLERNHETRLRIANNTGSGLYIYKIVSRTYQEMAEVTLRSVSPAEGEVCFYNLKKEIVLNFNKNIVAGSGALLLNGVEIPLNTCEINGNVVTIPVTLEGTPSVNKNYTFTASAGCFAESGNTENVSKAVTVNFQTLKTVAYPAGYAARMDVVYKQVNSSNCRMDIYYPVAPVKAVPVVINMHGGGWNHGYKEEQGGFNMYFNQGYAVANVEYRMTGEATAPAAVEDVRGAMVYLLHHAAEFNIDKNKVIFQGGSAGGHLALTAGYLQNNKVYDRDIEPYEEEIKVLAVIDKYGPSQLKDFLFYSSLVNWLGDSVGNETFIRTVSPVSLVNAATPPTYIIHGDADPTVPYSQSVTLKDTLDAFGVKNMFTTVPGGGHGGFPSEYNAQMESEIISFLNEVIAEQEAATGITDAKLKDGLIGVSGDSVTILSDAQVMTNVYDLSGRTLMATRDKVIDLPGKGFFILSIDMENTRVLQKILVQ